MQALHALNILLQRVGPSTIIKLASSMILGVYDEFFSVVCDAIREHASKFFLATKGNLISPVRGLCLVTCAE